jgi:hypothetical protein
MKVVCAPQQVNGIDPGSVDAALLAALCCCTASLVIGCLEGRFMQRVNLLLPW